MHSTLPQNGQATIELPDLEDGVLQQPSNDQPISFPKISGFIDLEFGEFSFVQQGSVFLVAGQAALETLEILAKGVSEIHNLGMSCARALGHNERFAHIGNQCRPLAYNLGASLAKIASDFEYGLIQSFSLQELRPEFGYPENWKSPYARIFINHALLSITTAEQHLAIDSSARRYVEPAGKFDALVFCNSSHQGLQDMLRSYYGGSEWSSTQICNH